MSLLESSNAPRWRVTSFLPPLSGQRIEVDAVYPQDRFFKITTNIPRRVKTSLPRQQDEGSEAISSSSCQKLLRRETVGTTFTALETLSPSFYAGPTHSLPSPVHPGTQSTSADTRVQTLPVGSRSLLAQPPHPQGTHCQVKGIIVSITKQKGGENCGLKAQGKETGILYRLLNVQFKTW